MDRGKAVDPRLLHRMESFYEVYGQLDRETRIAALGRFLREMADMGNLERGRRSEEWLMCFSGLVYYYESEEGCGGAFEHALLLVNQMLLWPEEALLSMDIDLAEVIRLTGVIAVRLAERGRFASAMLVARGLNSLVDFLDHKNSEEECRLILTSYLAIGNIMVSVNDYETALGCFPKALDCCVGLERFGAERDIDWDLQTYMLGLRAFAGTGKWSNVNLILEVYGRAKEGSGDRERERFQNAAQIFGMYRIILYQERGEFRRVIEEVRKHEEELTDRFAIGCEEDGMFSARLSAEKAGAHLCLEEYPEAMIAIRDAIVQLDRSRIDYRDDELLDPVMISCRIMAVLVSLRHREVDGALPLISLVADRACRDLEVGERRVNSRWDREVLKAEAFLPGALSMLARAEMIAEVQCLDEEILRLLVDWEEHWSSSIFRFRSEAWISNSAMDSMGTGSIGSRVSRLETGDLGVLDKRLSRGLNSSRKGVLGVRSGEVVVRSEDDLRRITREISSGAIAPATACPLASDCPDESEPLAAGPVTEDEIRRIQSGLTGEECVLVFVFCFNRGCLMCIETNRIQAIKMGKDEFTRIVGTLRSYQDLVDGSSMDDCESCGEFGSGYSAFSVISESALRSLEEAFVPALIEVVNAVGDDVRRLYIMHDSNVECFPYHCFEVGGRVFGEIFDIFYIPSLRVLDRSKRSTGSLSGKVVVAGNRCSSLPFVSIEEELVWRSREREYCRIVPADQIGKVVENASVLHFCGHIDRDPLYPLRTSIILGGRFRLSVGDLILRCHLMNCGIVIINGCNSGSYRRSMLPGFRANMDERFSLGNEAVSLACSFLMAGAKCTLSSLWPIWDLAALLFIWRFTMLLEQAKSVIEAFRMTVIWMSRDICDGNYLRSVVLPEISDMVDDGEHRKRLEEAIREHADRHVGAPPFGKRVYWAGYILSGCT